jgi:metacaspase-1
MSQALNYGLFVGTNYAGTNNELYGCINDATDLQKLFQSQCQETKTLLGKEASRKNILDELKRILGLMTRQDTLIFSYSGHGTWVADTSGDEPDGKDEAICPDDFPDTGILLDDDIDKASRQQDCHAD